LDFWREPRLLFEGHASTPQRPFMPTSQAESETKIREELTAALNKVIAE
jgi:hypothetical protein